MRRSLAVALALAAVAVAAVPTGAGAAQRARFDTDLLARIPTPGFPALGYVHPSGRIYEGTYVNPSGSSAPSRIFEYTGAGELLRSWTVPGQDLAGDHGVQVTTSYADGDLVVLDHTPARALRLDRHTGRFTTFATFADLKPCPSGQTGPNCSATLTDGPPIPNYGAWGPDGALYVTDYGQGVVWRVPPRGGAAAVWLADKRLDGGEFGTTGIMLAAGGKSLYVAQGSSAGLGALNPTTGKLFSVPIGAGGKPGALRQLWESRPGDLPDGFAIAASGRIYVPLVGLPQQIAVLAADGREIERFPGGAGSGDNGSGVPFDSPSSARFLGTRLIVANQSAVAGDASHQALLDVEVGERGLTELIPGLDQTPPVLSHVSVRPRRFAVVRRHGKLHRARRGHPARGTRLRLRTSERVTLDARVERRFRGRWRRLETIRRDLGKGRRSIAFKGRGVRGARNRALPRGRYRFSLQAHDAAGNRSARILRGFRIVRGR